MRPIVLCATVLALVSNSTLAQAWPPWADEAFGGRRTWSDERPHSSPKPGELPLGERKRLHGPAVVQAGPRPHIAPEVPALVAFPYDYPASSVVIDTAGRKLYYVAGEKLAYEYPISVGRESFNWTGTEVVSRKQAWPDWHPPEEMRQRDRSLPEKMMGGIRNPLGAMALYLGTTLYRIHGTNDEKSIGQAQSSGCFRMRNSAVLHLASVVEVGTTVTVVSSLPEHKELSDASPGPEKR
jgi:lipoprotein-anchoring transpeptidase ErfK/SrfK